METMILSLSNFKSLKELTEYIIELKNNTISRWYIKNTYGSFEKFEKIITDEWIRINCNKAAEESTITKENCQDCKSNIKETEEVKNISKKCKLYGDPYLRDGKEGIIKDVVKETGQHLVVTGLSNINYVNFENVKIIDEWKDIEIKGFDKDYGNFSIVITKDKIKVIFPSEDWSEDDDTYELNLKHSIKEKLINNIESKKNKVIEYILAKIEVNQLDKDYNEVMNKAERLQREYIKQSNIAESLLKEMM